MTLPIVVVFGACFGLATDPHRHLFGEGSVRRAEGRDRQPVVGRLDWALIGSGLWPLMLLTGLHTWWRLTRARRVR